MEESKPNGYPVDGGWTSSAYGQRIDPFKGVKAWHAGIDITSVNKESPVKALASGVVIFSGERRVMERWLRSIMRMAIGLGMRIIGNYLSRKERLSRRGPFRHNGGHWKIDRASCTCRSSFKW